MAAGHAPAGLDPERDFERLRPLARRRFLARARRAGQAGRVDLDAAADDAYQEAWLELQKRPAEVEHDPASYLAGIMWHRFHRLELRPARVETAPLEDDSPAGDDGPDAVVERRQTLAAVRDALAELPDRERTALLLRADGLGNDDVAATLGVSRRIARKLTERGRAGLTRELEAEERCVSMESTLRAIGLGWPVRGDRRARLEDHLAHCVTCGATVAALRREGALAATPPVLAGHGALARLRDLLEGVLGRGGGEAVAAATGAKVVAGCLAAGVCVVGVTQLTPPADPRPAPAAPTARSPVKPEAPAPRGAAAVTAQRQEDAERRAQRTERRQAQRLSKTAQAQVRTAVERAREGAERAQAGADRARAGADRARAALPAAMDAADRAREAGQRGREAADRVRDALAGIGGG